MEEAKFGLETYHVANSSKIFLPAPSCSIINMYENVHSTLYCTVLAVHHGASLSHRRVCMHSAISIKTWECNGPKQYDIHGIFL